MDIQPIERILEIHQIPPQTFETIKNHPRFLQLLESEVTAWNAAVNTAERTKLKAAALVEEWLPEANGRLHDPGEALPAKVELGKLIARIAGIGLTGATVDAPAERLSITINLGQAGQLKFEKDVTPQVIDATSENS